MATFSSGMKCFRSFLIRSLRYLNGGTLSPFPTEAGQEKNTKPEEKNAKQEQRTTETKPAEHAQRGGGNRIPADKYKAHFGSSHTFRVSAGDYSNHRFQYGGYWFGFVDPWPNNWLYTQNVYVIEIGGMYYRCNPVYPGVNLSINVTL